MRRKVLFISPLPPPHYGSAMSSKMCLKVLQDSEKFEVKDIKLNYSKNVADMGRFNRDKIVGFFKVKKEIKQKIKEFKPDLIYFMPATSNLGLIRDYFFTREIKRHWNEKILFHLRARITMKDWDNKFFRRIFKKMFLGQKAIILDKSLRGDLHGLIKEKDLFIVPNAIENEISEKKLKSILKDRTKNNSFNIIFLSNMIESKGWFKLLEASKILKERGIKFTCNFVGSWPGKREELKFNAYVERNKLKNYVRHLGKRTGNAKNKILKDSDVLVFPTEFPLETFGRVIIEGMMFGLPIIANGIAAIPTTIQNKKTGFVLKENTPKEIAEKIEKLYRDKDLREKMGELGRKRFVKHYTLEFYRKSFNKIILNN
jgi:glycosyltransferase involved in cell wall biosynthesis